jgi:maltose-binding protein MalE
MTMWYRLLALFALVTTAVPACSTPRDDGSVVLWHSYSGSEKTALEEVVADLNRRGDGPSILLVQVPYDAFADKITNAIPNGNGPDLFIFAHDRLGDWVATGVVEPVEYFVDDELADRFAYDAIAAMAYDGNLYGLPLAAKSVALFYRTDQIDSPPQTTDELISGGHRLVYDNTDLYFHAPWLHGFGAELFDDQGELTIVTPEAIAALEFARDLAHRYGVVPSGVTTTMVATLFNEGEAPLAISGPWFIGDIREGVKWSIAPLPIVSATGQPARPFLGAEGVMMSSRARNKQAAFAVMNALTSDDSATLRARRARQVVPNKGAYDHPDIGGDPVLAAFRAQLDRSRPMPATPAMRMVWTPYKTALQKAINGGEAPEKALRAAEREIRSYLEGVNP